MIGNDMIIERMHEKWRGLLIYSFTDKSSTGLMEL